MKKSKKQKFTDYNDFYSKKNTKEKLYNNSLLENKQPENAFQQYETSLQALQRLFPTIPEDLIENIFEESSRTYMTTKSILEEMMREEMIEKTENHNDPERNIFEIKQSKNLNY
jgi:hypothetical protein